MELCERARRVQKRFAIENAPHTHTVEAMELYEEAARTLETRREVELAADCYAKCADACLRQKKQLEAAVFWAKSASVGHCPERRERAVASCCAVEAYSEAGYVTAEKDTMFAFEIFRAANEDNKAALCLEKAAERLASAELFERLSETLARDNLTAPNCPRILLRASLCRLVENFKMVDLPRGSWLATPEYRFARDLAECVSAELPDRDNFADYVYDFSQVRQLTLFDLTILQKIHLNIEKIHQDHRLKTERAARKAERRKKREIEARERQLRIQRDFQ